MIAPRICLIHATPLAVAPVQAAFERLWPEAVRMNLLDDRLAPDLEATGRIDAALMERFAALARYAVQAGAQGVLFTCSAFGPAIEAAAAAAGVPTLKPNEAMFDEALDRCAARAAPGRAARIGMVATFAPSVAGMREELLALAARRGIACTLQVQCPGGALQALREGRADAHDALVEQAAGRLAGCDVLMLAQFSMAHLRERAAAAAGIAALSSPDSAVRRLRACLADPIPSPSTPHP
ncbi:aspartate/glutamate racemase family protein [Pseudorhodoferax sp.]|uniref:aspartate/glutamate racemase family protein n=1 Tax=Pseudorhodoferax sp. TaxID=1993553 RepID=UPI0039E282B6